MPPTSTALRGTVSVNGLPRSTFSPVGDEIVNEMRLVQLRTQSFTVSAEIWCFVVVSIW